MQNDLQVFATVVERSSFAGAAKALGITRSAVCRRIDRFEKRLGVRLLDRTTRRINLTDAGEALYQRSLRILADIAEAEEIVSDYGGEPQGVLKVGSPIMIGLHKLVPLLPEFIERYPQIKIHLNLTDDWVDASFADHDAAIRWGPQVSSSLIITKIGESRQIICCAPSYLARHGEPRTPEDLENHNCLLMTRLGLNANEWVFRGSSDNLISVKVTGNFVTNGGHGNYHAMIAGLGIARVTDLRVSEDIAEGRLRPILTAYEPAEAMPIYVAFKSGRLVPPKVRAFVTFLQQRFMARNNAW